MTTNNTQLVILQVKCYFQVRRFFTSYVNKWVRYSLKWSPATLQSDVSATFQRPGLNRPWYSLHYHVIPGPLLIFLVHSWYSRCPRDILGELMVFQAVSPGFIARVEPPGKFYYESRTKGDSIFEISLWNFVVNEILWVFRSIQKAQRQKKCGKSTITHVTHIRLSA